MSVENHAYQQPAEGAIYESPADARARQVEQQMTDDERSSLTPRQRTEELLRTMTIEEQAMPLLLDRLGDRDGQTLGQLCAALPDMTRIDREVN
jgi:hypothetical protein